MHMFSADQQINASDSQNNGKQDNSRCRCIGGIAAAVSVQHIVYVAHDGIHLRRIQVCAEKCHCVAVGLECPDKSRDDQIDQGGRDHGQRDSEKDPKARGAVHLCGIIIGLVHRRQRAGQDQDLKGHDHPDGIKAQHEHFRRIGSVNEVDGASAELVDDQVYKSVRVGSLLKQDHEHKAHGQGVCHVGQKEDGLEQFLQGLDGA